MTDFVRNSTEIAAERSIEGRSMLVLTARETETLAESLLKPRALGPTLRCAARMYRKTVAER
jgi:uncharacterized protein (DUF1778 family)